VESSTDTRALATGGLAWDRANHDVILKEILAGSRHRPFDESLVGPGSVDLTLGNEFRLFKKMHTIYHVTNHSDFNEITELVTVDDCFVLMPGRPFWYHVRTDPSALVPVWLAGRAIAVRPAGSDGPYHGRFHATWDRHRQVLEISNVSSVPLPCIRVRGSASSFSCARMVRLATRESCTQDRP